MTLLRPVCCLLLAWLASGCSMSMLRQVEEGVPATSVWNLGYNYTDDTSEGTKRGVFMDYIDGQPISFTRPGAVLAPGRHRIEVQCYLCDDHLGYAIDRHVFETELQAGHEYTFDTRPAGVDHCDAWLAEKTPQP